jgi:hypothetical protein
LDCKPPRGEPPQGKPSRGGPPRGEPYRGVPLRGEPPRGEPPQRRPLWGVPLQGGPSGRHPTAVSVRSSPLAVSTRTSRADEPQITVDNIEVAQFVYLMLNNQKVRDVIETITSKVVLILGRFTDERKAVLDALREELRKHNYLPILFDFDVPATRDITETVSLLARMARFIICRPD